MSEQVRAILAELRQQLEALYSDRLELVILFGSQARGDAELGSDIDVLVVLRGDVDPFREIDRTSHLIADLPLQHDTVVSRVFMSAERFGEDPSPFLMNVHREGIAI